MMEFSIFILATAIIVGAGQIANAIRQSKDKENENN